jgi:hypothetical protein
MGFLHVPQSVWIIYTCHNEDGLCYSGLFTNVMRTDCGTVNGLFTRVIMRTGCGTVNRLFTRVIMRMNCGSVNGLFTVS